MFRHSETKIFQRKNVIYPPFHPQNFCETRNFLKNSRIPLQKFSALWDKQFSAENCDTSNMHKLFRLPQTFWNFKWMPTLFSALSDLKLSTYVKNVIPLICTNFSMPQFFWKHCRDAQEIFRLCETKIFRWKNVIPPFSIRKNVSKRELLSKTVGFVYKHIPHCETENFWRKNVLPSIIPKIFRLPKTFWNLEGMLKNFFGIVRPKVFDRKTWYPLLYIKLSDTTILLKPWRDAHENFRHFETEIFWRKNVIPIMHKFFGIDFFWNIERMPTNFVGTVRPKIIHRKTWYPQL